MSQEYTDNFAKNVRVWSARYFFLGNFQKVVKSGKNGPALSPNVPIEHLTTNALITYVQMYIPIYQ